MKHHGFYFTPRDFKDHWTRQVMLPEQEVINTLISIGAEI